jgi:hypothetical protein
VTEAERLARAQRAKVIFEDPLFREVLDMLVAEQTDVFRGSTCTDAQVLEAHRMVLALSAVEARLVSFITDGKVVEKRTKR